MMANTLREFLGWKFRWCLVPNEYIMVMMWLPIYMPIKQRLARKSQVTGRITKGFWAGFMDGSRGLSWSRKSRYGEK